jgi:hypothetical protein
MFKSRPLESGRPLMQASTTSGKLRIPVILNGQTV